MVSILLRMEPGQRAAIRSAAGRAGLKMAPWALRTLLTATNAPSLALPTLTAPTVVVEPTVTRDDGAATPTTAIDRSEGTDELAAALMRAAGLNEKMLLARLLCTCAVVGGEHVVGCQVPASIGLIVEDDGSTEEVAAALTDMAALRPIPLCAPHGLPQPCLRCLA